VGKAWDDSAGEAIKNKLEYIKFQMGTNKMRMVGEILPRYAYWKKLKDFNIPVECLSFDRDKETFTNLEKDHFREHFPLKPNGDKNYPSWSYVIKVLDPNDNNKVKLCGLKKKLFEQIQSHAKKHLGDPTNPETGWMVVFEKKSTGPLPFQVEYTLDQMACEVTPLTEEQVAAIADTPSIDTLIPRPTADDQLAFIKASWLDTDKEENVDTAAAAAAGSDKDEDDILF